MVSAVNTALTKIARCILFEIVELEEMHTKYLDYVVTTTKVDNAKAHNGNESKKEQ